MADPWTIVGSASAILTFVEFAGKCVKTAKNLHQSGRTEDNARFENVVTKMQDLIDGVKAERAGTPTSEAEAGLFAIANECEDLGRAILQLLHRTRKSEGSLRETIRASVSTVWNEKEVEDLQNQLQQCTTHLNAQMLAIMRSETGHKLERILAMQSSHSREVGSLRDLITDLSTNQAGALDTLSSLRRLFGTTDSILEKINHQQILDALRVPEMKQRYDQVSDAAKGTFDWLIESSEIPDHPELLSSLSTWLSEGKGIFHISGKPGSGKSTLMKHIAESERTAALLDVWAGEEKLAKASVFIWKYGDPIQRTVIGVVRSLLCSILIESPDLMPKVFPRHWEPRRHSPWLPTPDLHITPRDVLEAFEKCIDPSGPAQHTRICLLLDGLDELNDPDELHTNFALRLMRWSNDNPDRLKICVTSREENAFMDNFSPQQRLRLHRVTQGDVRRLVTTRLNEHPRFRTFTEADRERFCSQITEQSSGVFLWVKLVLDEIYENLDQQRSFGALQKVLDQVPEELEDFFYKIFNSIRKTNQEEAYIMFLLALEFAYTPALVYSFVEDVLALKMGNHQIDNYSMTLNDLEVRHKSFSARLRGLNRGLLEITGSKDASLDGFEDPHGMVAFRYRVRPVHRSLNDWLVYSMPDTLKHFSNAIDKRGIFLKCVILHAQLVPWVQWSSRGWYRFTHSLITSISQSPAFNTRESIHMAQLGKLDDILRQKYSKYEDASDNMSNTSHQDSSSVWSVSLLHQSCEHYFVPFVDWGLQNLTFAQDPHTRVELLDRVCSHGRNGDWSRPRGFELCLDALLKSGVNPNSDSGEQHRMKSTPWLNFLFFKMKSDLFLKTQRDSTSGFGRKFSPGMRQLLEADADPRIFLVWLVGKQSGFKVIWDPDYQLHMDGYDGGFSERTIQLGELDPYDMRSRYGQVILDEIEFLRKIRDWPFYKKTEDEVSIQITLRDFVQACLPEQADTLLPLIDRNLARREPNHHTIVDGDSITLQSGKRHIQDQDQEGRNGAKSMDKDAADERAGNETQVHLFDTWRLAVIFMVLGIFLGVVIAKLF